MERKLRNPGGFRNRLLLFLKGIAMGSADVVPGVSGGTIAFITGIYEELVDSIRSFDGDAARLLIQRDFRGFNEHVNGGFLVVLVAGIATAILSLAMVVLYLLDHFPVLIWSFFFGLIVASVFIVGKSIEKFRPSVLIAGIGGTFFAYWITVAIPMETPETLGFVFISGAIAICAMILPGISGSFVLVLLGKYQFILGALKNMDITTILAFVAGTVCGILSFSRLLNWMLKHFHDLTIAMLTGIMIGSLNKVWPWKKTIETFVNRKGEIKPLIVENILPSAGDPMIFYAAGLAIAGFFLVYAIERLVPQNASSKNRTESEY